MVSVLELRLLQFAVHVRVFVLSQLLLPLVVQDDQEPQDENSGGPERVYKLSRRLIKLKKTTHRSRHYMLLCSWYSLEGDL